MQFSALFKYLCKQHGITQKKALADMGFGENANQKWKTGMPSTKSLQIIAEYFGVTVGWLIEQCTVNANSTTGRIIGSAVVQGNSGSTIRFNSTAHVNAENQGAGALNEQEAELLRIFRGLNLRGKTAVLACAYAEDERQQSK